MTDLRQAAQQALEALDSGNPYHQQLAAKVLRTALEQQAEPFLPEAIVKKVKAWKMGYEAAKAEQQQAEPVQEPVARVIDNGTPEGATEWIPFTNRVEPLETGDLLYTTPPQQQAEPVAHVLFRQDDDGLEPIMFYSPKTAPDPRTLKDRFVLKDVWLSPPPQRQWVGLTDDEILSTDPWEILRADPWMGTSDSNINPYQILLKVRTLEAKLKERNHD